MRSRQAAAAAAATATATTTTTSTTTGGLNEEEEDGIPSDDRFTTRAVLGWCAGRWPPEEGAAPPLSFSDFLEMWLALSM